MFLPVSRPRSLPRELLIVEDDPVQVKAYEAFARRQGISLRFTPRTTEALRLALLHSPDAIVLDVELEDGHSLNLLRALRATPETAHIPVAVVSGYLSEHVEKTIRDIGGVLTLAKPWTIDELLALFGGLYARAS